MPAPVLRLLSALMEEEIGAEMKMEYDKLTRIVRLEIPDDHAIVTSLPDHSELPALGVEGWKTWFADTVALACRAVADHSVAIFYAPAGSDHHGGDSRSGRHQRGAERQRDGHLQ